jgi:putative heme iron utilization protein
LQRVRVGGASADSEASPTGESKKLGQFKVRSIDTNPLTSKIMADPITPAIGDRICKHMNEDHGEAVLTYAKVYGKSPTAETAVMSALDPLGMDLMAQVDGETISLRIAFDRELQDSEDAHQTLITMIKEARKLSA